MKGQNKGNLSIPDEFAIKIKSEHRREQIMRYAPASVLVLMVLIFSAIAGGEFASINNLIAVLNQIAIPLLIASGLTFVILLGSIDLSIDGTVGMAGSLLSILILNTKNGNDFGIFGVLLAIGASVLVGLLIGVIHVKLKIPSFMVSFGFMYICKGIAILSYGGIPASISGTLFVALPKVSFIGIPFITWVAIIMVAIAFFIQEYTPFGRHIFAVGTDERIPKSVGVNVDNVKIKVFVLAGLLFGVAGVLGAIRLGQGQSQIGEGLMFPAQAAVVAGGTALSGGKGGVSKTIIGVFIMVVLNNGLSILHVNPYINSAIEGLIILTAVSLTVAKGRKVISK
jgi:ribose transport system permease protein